MKGDRHPQGETGLEHLLVRDATQGHVNQLEETCMIGKGEHGLTGGHHKHRGVCTLLQAFLPPGAPREDLGAGWEASPVVLARGRELQPLLNLHPDPSPLSLLLITNLII